MEIINQITENRFAGYSYSYPHKHAYSRFSQPLKLINAWRNEKKNSLFLYVHIPFCEMRCNFCNLFTLSKAEASLIEAYLLKLKRQAEIIASELGDFKISRIAIGGGTPTILGIEQLKFLLEFIETIFHVDFSRIPCSIECSPSTISSEKLTFLKEKGITRVSIGIQSLVENETHTMGRPETMQVVSDALLAIKAHNFPRFNIDLIYGYEKQSLNSLEYTLEQMSRFKNNEVFIYPLYIRPLTGFYGLERKYPDNRVELYELGRSIIVNEGFRQLSMRFFQKDLPVEDVSEYSCQQDGMIGLGAGARSYTSSLHYSYEYAISGNVTKNIIQSFCSMDDKGLSEILYGIVLNIDEQKRRFVIKSLLHHAGINQNDYFNIFDSRVLTDFPVLTELSDSGFCILNASIQLTTLGMDYSDAIGPLFYSEHIKNKITGFQLM